MAVRLNHIEEAVQEVKKNNDRYPNLKPGANQLPNWQLRGLWAGHFSENEGLRNECRHLLRDLFMKGIDYRMPQWRVLMWRTESELPKKDYILAPVPVTGIIHGCNAYSSFSISGREPSEIVFTGYSPYQRTMLEDGSRIKKEVYVNAEDLKILQRGAKEKKGIVFVDDIVDSGGTLRELTSFARKIGFKDIMFFDSMGKEYYSEKIRISESRSIMSASIGRSKPAISF